MADRVFCIDFGSAYTKVALRRDPGADSELIACRGAETDFWVPSTIAVDRRGTKPVAEFGDRAADLQAGGGIEVHTNWKKSLFITPDAGKPGQSPLESLLESEELAQLAAKHSVPAGQLGYLRQLVGAARSLIGGPGGRSVSPEAQKQTYIASLAPHFFRWLRQQVLEACARLSTTGLKFEEIPVRLAVPAFTNGTDLALQPGCKLLMEAVGKGGWPLHPEQPLVSEPYSNVIGILTKAANVLHRSRVHLGNMFGKGPLITVLKDFANYPSYRAVVVDVGAFTTDFASLTLKPNGEIIANPDVAFELRQQSVPMGVSNLDDRIREALSKEKAEWLRQAKTKDWETFRRGAYTDGKGYRSPTLGVIGGASDAPAVQGCLKEFSNHLAAEVRKFCEGLETASLQELILTGGGSAIPAVRDAIQKAAESAGGTYAKTHAPALKRTGASSLVHKLDDRFTRGGSALGGSSIYFERGFY